MALFNFSNDWETSKTGEDLCESFMKDGKAHKKKHKKKNKKKAKSNNTSILSNDKKYLLVNEVVSNTERKHNNKNSQKNLKSKKHILKNTIRKKIGDRVKVNGRADEKIALNRFTEREKLKLSLSRESNKIEKYDNKTGLKRKRTLSETIDENDTKPLLKKIKSEKKRKNTDIMNNFNSDSNKTKIKKKKVKKEKQNEDSLQELSTIVSNNRSNKIKKMLKNVDIGQILHGTKKFKEINRKLKNKKNKQFQIPSGDSVSENPSRGNTIDPVQLKKRKKQLEKLQTLVLQNQEKQSTLVPKKEEPIVTLRQKMMQKLKAARFRFLNEQIYTATSKDTEKIFKRDPDAFKAYHEGYRQQVQKWPLNPLDRIIKSINKLPKTHVVADFGCGEARLADSVEQQVYSFDLIAINDTVIACDMAHVPLEDSSIDVAVFCLSLMGTNLKDYLLEANRVLKNRGLLKIAEVESRFDDIKSFTKDCEQFGFKKTWMDLSHNLFYFIDLKKESSAKGKKKLPSISLQPCLYKKR